MAQQNDVVRHDQTSVHYRAQSVPVVSDMASSSAYDNQSPDI